MAGSVLVDAGFVIALLSRRDGHHHWAVAQSSRYPPPWSTCEAALSEGFHLLGGNAAPVLAALLRRRAMVPSFDLNAEMRPVLHLMQRYENVPMSLADGCLVRMTETRADPILLTTDGDFRIYRRHGRQTAPAVLPD